MERKIVKALETAISFQTLKKQLCGTAVLFRPVQSFSSMEGSVLQTQTLNLVLNLLF